MEKNKYPRNDIFLCGGQILYSIVTSENKAIDCMKATKKIADDRDEIKKIDIKVTGDSFEEVKEKICEKIDALNEDQNL